MTEPDISGTHALERLFDLPREARDAGWLDSFYETVKTAAIEVCDTQAIEGPDGFPYLNTRMPRPGEFEAHSIEELAEACTDQGVGVVLNAHGQPPSWVFYYGQLWSLRAYGGFTGDGLGDSGEPAEGIDELPAGAELMLGAPAPSLLPDFARPVLRSYLQHVGVQDPAVVLMIDSRYPKTRNLVFNLYAEDFESGEDFEDAMQTLAWFLPPGLATIAIPKGALDIPHEL